MKTRYIYFILTSFCIIIACEGNQPSGVNSKTISSPDGAFELIVYGEKVGSDLFPNRIALRNSSDKNEVEFVPKDIASIQQSKVNFSNVWSPDGKKLVLPQGRFDGLTLFYQKDLPKAIEAKSTQKCLVINGLADSNWWHEMIGWKNNTSFQFKAGLSGDMYNFEWNTITNKVSSQDLSSDQYKVAIN